MLPSFLPPSFLVDIISVVSEQPYHIVLDNLGKKKTQ